MEYDFFSKQASTPAHTLTHTHTYQYHNIHVSYLKKTMLSYDCAHRPILTVIIKTNQLHTGIHPRFKSFACNRTLLVLIEGEIVDKNLSYHLKYKRKF